MDAETASVIKTALITGSIVTGVALQALVTRRKSKPETTSVDGLSVRLERMEQTIDSIAIEMERVSEAQRFTAKLLAERSDGSPVRPPGRVITPH
jgi:regulator of sirC expression with transglutaminase-like and TPR domain